MTYDPEIKNLPYLIQDLRKLLSGQIDVKDLCSKVSGVDYEFNSSDGFEDILDIIRPFIKEFKNSDADQVQLRDLIEMLRVEAPLSEIESYFLG